MDDGSNSPDKELETQHKKLSVYIKKVSSNGDKEEDYEVIKHPDER